ncbi:hypothetical protein J0910_06890 [Nocardiopsis sp. CNT-189]|uniref:hypothetical protein n=1 Tax=Nocardiopsis oceanisediminis TaxID=2816862 RepID=UPI003B3639FF
MRFPVDCSKMKFRVAIPPRPDMDFEVGRQKIRGGALMVVATLSAMNGEEGEYIRVRYPGDGVKFSQDDPVIPVDLFALHWSINGRSGMAFGAEFLRLEDAPTLQVKEIKSGL